MASTTCDRKTLSYFFPLVPGRPLSRVALLSSLVWRDDCCCSSYLLNCLCTSVGWDTAVIATAPAETTAFASFLFTMTFSFQVSIPWQRRTRFFSHVTLPIAQEEALNLLLRKPVVDGEQRASLLLALKNLVRSVRGSNNI